MIRSAIHRRMGGPKSNREPDIPPPDHCRKRCCPCPSSRQSNPLRTN